MTDTAYKVTVDKNLEDLIPTFLSNRHKELDALRVALAAADFEQLRQLGHRMRGVGNSYGFDRVSDIGRSVEDGARSGNKADIDKQIADYADYLSRLQISYE